MKMLSHAFTDKKIKVALFQMHAHMARGPDGITSLFFQKYWHLVADLVISIVLDILNFGTLPTELN